MASLFKDNGYVSRSESGIASNSVVITNGKFVQTSAAGIILAATTWKIAWIANGTKTYASDNFTVAKDVVSYTKARQWTLFKCTITGWTVTIADEWVSFYNLSSDSSTIDGTTETANAQTVDAAAVGSTPVLNAQFKLVKFISATKGIFEALV